MAAIKKILFIMIIFAKQMFQTLFNKIVIDQEISYRLRYRSFDCCIDPRPSASGHYSRPRTCTWADTKFLD